MKRKIIIILLTLILAFSATAATMILAQDESSTPQVQRMENALFSKLRGAVSEGLISRDLATRIVYLWKQKTDNDLPQLYQRAMNLLNSKEEAQAQKASFFSLVRQAVSQGSLTLEKASEVKTLWEQKSQDEQTKLYHRLANLVNGSGRS